MKQVDKIRELHRQFNGDEALVVQAYAASEKRGEVIRNSNVYDMSSEEYAYRLFYNTFKRRKSLR